MKLSELSKQADDMIENISENYIGDTETLMRFIMISSFIKYLELTHERLNSNSAIQDVALNELNRFCAETEARVKDIAQAVRENTNS